MFILFFKKYHDTASREVPSFGFGFFSFFLLPFFLFFLGWGALRIAGWNSLFFWFFFQCELWRKSWLLFCNSFFFQNWLIETSSRWKTGVSLTFGSRPTDRGHHLWIENHLLRDVFFLFYDFLPILSKIGLSKRVQDGKRGFPKLVGHDPPVVAMAFEWKITWWGLFFFKFYDFFPILSKIGSSKRVLDEKKTGVSQTGGSRPTDRGHRLWMENRLLSVVVFETKHKLGNTFK